MEATSLGNGQDVKLDLDPVKPICRCCLSTERRMYNALYFVAFFKDLTGINVSILLYTDLKLLAYR